ncbi:MAG: MMPL family transporter [Bacteroidetes bacterium]|nr:MMPL family transporter [Bacteroidota bacterium]
MKSKIKEFRPTSWSIDNKTSIFVLVIIISIFGMLSYNSIPKEQFPELVIPTYIVSTVYSGTSPTDMENLVTRPIEKNLKSVNGIKKITSNSIQDFSMIIIEFNTDVNQTDAKQKVKDAVDKSKKDLPDKLTVDPTVSEIDFSEFPIMNINISGDYEVSKLKDYADIIQDRIESMKEITRVDIIGALDREIQINADMYKMQVADVSLTDIERAVASENITISSGSIDMVGMKRAIRVVGEFTNIETLKNIVVKSSSGAIVYLKDIAEVKDDFKERESYARLNDKNVLTLNVIKKSGENLIDASDKINDALADLKLSKLPSKLKIDITGEQAKFTKRTLTELNNTIIIGFILVTIILMFFMGFTNAFFVGLSVPLSIAIAYIVMPGIGFTMNMLVMFSFIFALGIVVDDAIVVIENTHRIFKQNKGKISIKKAAKLAAGEVFIPILSGTLTTLAPFFPLAFWPGVVGKFMYFIPVTLIITLFASLFVAYIINPVFAVQFMAHDDEEEIKKTDKKKMFKVSGIIAAFALLCYVIGWIGIANFLVFVMMLYIIHNIYMAKVLFKFQHRFIPAFMNRYEKLLKLCLKGKRPFKLLWGTFALLFITFIIVGIAKPKVEFFPANQPNYIYTYIKLPVGTSLQYTDSITRIVEKRIKGVVGQNNPYVESLITNVALSAADPMDHDNSVASNKAKITVAFVEFAKRNRFNTFDYLDSIRNAVKGISTANITVEANRNGPPTGKAINIEITGDNIDSLVVTSHKLLKYINLLAIPGIEELKSDFEEGKPEIIIDINRERANREGVSTATIGMEIRSAIFGKEISKYREDEDQYPMQLRYSEKQRKNIDALMNLKITYRDMNTGILRQIPLSSIAKISYVNSYGGIKRKNLKRIINLTSNVLSGYTANEVVANITKAVKSFNAPEGVEVELTGEQEDQKDSMNFLNTAMILALCLIFFILITQFNSTSKPLIILAEVLFSLIGVLLGYIIFGMTISIIMTGIGIVALAGIVVRNGILLVEFTDVLKERGHKTKDAIVQAGKTRITPVLLTASATIIGLVPLAIGFNINFITMFTDLNPQIHFGGENVQFFGKLAWTIIFGLSFATFLTLILVPIMYYIAYTAKVRVGRRRSNRLNKKNLPYYENINYKNEDEFEAIV